MLFSRLRINLEGSLPADTHQKSILINGGAGGVGSIACQLASQLAGLTVIATDSRRISWLVPTNGGWHYDWEVSVKCLVVINKVI